MNQIQQKKKKFSRTFVTKSLILIGVFVGFAVLLASLNGLGRKSEQNAAYGVSPYVVDIAGSQKKKTSATHSQMSILENSVNQRNVGKLRTDQDGKIADARNRPLAPPGLDQVRKEVQANPHLTPGSILEFASHLGSKMELALKSEEQGNLVFKELEDCTLNTIDYSPVSIRAVCLSNANVLGQRYSSLQLKYQALLGKADSESIRLSYIP